MTTSHTATPQYESTMAIADEPSLFQKNIVGPFKFILFILSLAAIAFRDDRSSNRTDSWTERDKGRTDSGPSDAKSRNGQRPRRSSQAHRQEFKQALESEEYLSHWIGRVLTGGGMILVALFLRGFLFRNAK